MAVSDTSQKVAIVTGASSGIGLYTALGLARAGMRVIMTGRNRDRTDAARDFVTARVGDAQIETALADFASLAAVRRLADEILSRHQRIDVLVNNAGLLSPSYRLSEDGYEMTFAVNHLAPVPVDQSAARSAQGFGARRGSSPSLRGRIAENGSTSRRLLARRAGRSEGLMAARSCATSCSLANWRGGSKAPALSRCACIQVSSRPGFGQRGGVVELGWRLAKPFMISAEKGAETSVFLATVPDPTPFHGGYVVNKKLERPDPAALDDGMARRLWEESARLVNL